MTGGGGVREENVWTLKVLLIPLAVFPVVVTLINS